MRDQHADHGSQEGEDPAELSVADLGWHRLKDIAEAEHLLSHIADQYFSRNSFFNIFPVPPFGSASKNSTDFGTLKPGRLARQ